MVFAFFFFFLYFYISSIRCTEYTTDMCADLKLPRHPINHNMADDILTQTWFIVMLGSIIAIIIFSFIGMVLIKRIQFIKQTSLTNIHGMYEIYVFACKQIYLSWTFFLPFSLSLRLCMAIFCRQLVFVHNRLQSFALYCIFVMRFFYSLLGGIERKNASNDDDDDDNDTINCRECGVRAERHLSVIIYHFYGFN